MDRKNSNWNFWSCDLVVRRVRTHVTRRSAGSAIRKGRMPNHRSCGLWPYALLALAAVAAIAVGPAWAAEGARKGPSEVIFIGQLLVLMIVGRLFGEAMLR